MRYGTDEDNWKWFVYIIAQCRVDLTEGITGLDLRAGLDLGNIKCPIKGKLCGRIKVPHPADNIAGPIAAKKFGGERCPVCGMRELQRNLKFNDNLVSLAGICLLVLPKGSIFMFLS